MQLLRQGGEQHFGPQGRGRTMQRSERGNRLAQHAGDDLGVQVLFKNFKPPLHPRLAHGHRQRGHQLGDERPQAHAHLCMVQGMAQSLGVVGGNRVQQGRQLGRVGGQGGTVCLRQNCAAGLAVLGQKLGQCCRIQPNHFVGAQASIEQAAHQQQPLHLLCRVETVATGIAQRLWKTIALLPDAQGVFGQSGLAFDSGNGQASFARGDRGGVHAAASRQSG